MDDQLTLSLALVSLVPSSSPFLLLASELKQAIFSALPDASTLSSLVLTCSDFYHTFRDAESLIIKSILHNQIGSGLLVDALIVLDARTLASYSEETVGQVLMLYTERTLTTTSNHQKWRLRHAVAVSSLYETIDYLSQDFARLALATNIVTGQDEPSPTPLSALESERIKRTFYRYELFYSLFREREEYQLDQRSSKSLQQFFFEWCEPWENEQLRCVRDYLLDRLSLPFNDVAEHDVEWGKLQMSYLEKSPSFDNMPFNTWTDFYLSFGLSALHQLFNTPTFEERCHFLKLRKKKSVGYSLSSGLQNAKLKQEQQLSNYQTNHAIETGSAIDTDQGPISAWRWGNISNGLLRNPSPAATLRRRAYVMWDSARLAAWGLLDKDWRTIPREAFDSSPRPRRLVDMVDSWKARREIWNRGGRGWWSPGDESRVVWT